ncbi:hypothetical protein ACFYSC_27390 [Streptosporangium sp. NPDC004379]
MAARNLVNGRPCHVHGDDGAAPSGRLREALDRGSQVITGRGCT